MSYAIQPVGSTAIKAGTARGGNSLGLVPTAQNWFNSVAEWTLPSDDAAGHAAVAKMLGSMREEADKRGLLLDFVFMNDASSPLQSPLRSYGLRNLQELKRVANEVDPEGVFQVLQGGGFKVDSA